MVKPDIYYDRDTFIKEALRLIEIELREGNTLASSTLFGDEVAATDWWPENAVDALFRYASAHGWGE